MISNLHVLLPPELRGITTEELALVIKNLCDSQSDYHFEIRQMRSGIAIGASSLTSWDNVVVHPQYASAFFQAGSSHDGLYLEPGIGFWGGEISAGVCMDTILRAGLKTFEDRLLKALWAAKQAGFHELDIGEELRHLAAQ